MHPTTTSVRFSSSNIHLLYLPNPHSFPSNRWRHGGHNHCFPSRRRSHPLGCHHRSRRLLRDRQRKCQHHTGARVFGPISLNRGTVRTPAPGRLESRVTAPGRCGWATDPLPARQDACGVIGAELDGVSSGEYWDV